MNIYNSLNKNITVGILLFTLGGVSLVQANTSFQGNTVEAKQLVAWGIKGKPPYNRYKMRRAKKNQSPAVEMSALEYVGSDGVKKMGRTAPKRRGSHHPDKSKSRAYR